VTRILLVAGAADVAENLCLLHILDGGRGIFPATMYLFASIKFSLLLLYVGWLLFSAGKSIAKKIA